MGLSGGRCRMRPKASLIPAERLRGRKLIIEYVAEDPPHFWIGFDDDDGRACFGSVHVADVLGLLPLPAVDDKEKQ